MPPDSSVRQECATHLKVEDPETALRPPPGVLPAEHVHLPAYERRLRPVSVAPSPDAVDATGNSRQSSP